MSPEQFTYWLQGFVELNGGKMPTEQQWKSIQEHLQTVFKKVTPNYFNPSLPIYSGLYDQTLITC